MLNLNLGCGSNRITNAINIDCNSSLKPDVVHNITDPLPYEDGSVDKVFLFHTIEHLEKKKHIYIFEHVWRVLRPYGKFYISYPEFIKCFKNWETNYRGMRDFWEATIFGRQSHPSDFHVCIIESEDLKYNLEEAGFGEIIYKPESDLEPYNTILVASKIGKPALYEDVLFDNVNRLTGYELRSN